jgi:hypothetical protein
MDIIGINGLKSKVWAQTPKSSSPPLILPNLERPTIQNRFAPREGAIVLFLGGGGHIRDDYYTSWGGQSSISYFFSDRWGIEGRVGYLWTSLSDEALMLRNRVGLVPDARPQSLNWSVGAQYALGYAKILSHSNLMHFDPLLLLHIGGTHADERILPTVLASFSPTFLFKYGLRFRLDLGLSIQFEQRDRGLVTTTGFMPMIQIGWGGTPTEIAKQFGIEKKP